MIDAKKGSVQKREARMERINRSYRARKWLWFRNSRVYFGWRRSGSSRYRASELVLMLLIGFERATKASLDDDRYTCDKREKMHRAHRGGEESAIDVLYQAREQSLENLVAQRAHTRHVYPERMPMILLSYPTPAIFDRRLFSRGTRHAVSPRF